MAQVCRLTILSVSDFLLRHLQRNHEDLRLCLLCLGRSCQCMGLWLRLILRSDLRSPGDDIRRADSDLCRTSDQLLRLDSELCCSTKLWLQHLQVNDGFLVNSSGL